MGLDFDRIKQRTRWMWTRGDYSKVAPLLRPAAEAIVDALSVTPSLLVLDVAAGNGNVAVTAARRGSRVVASDLTFELVEAGNSRTQDEGLPVNWVQADAEALPFVDVRFDRVTSVFGAMFAPRPGTVVSELFRVLRPGGALCMANWTPQGYMGEFLAMSRRYVEPPPEVPTPVEWGDEATVRRRLAPWASSIRCERRSLRWQFPSVAAARGFFDANFGPTVAAKEALPPERFEAMRREDEALIAAHNVADDGSCVYEPEYLLVVAQKAE